MDTKVETTKLSFEQLERKSNVLQVMCICLTVVVIMLGIFAYQQWRSIENTASKLASKITSDNTWRDKFEDGVIAKIDSRETAPTAAEVALAFKSRVIDKVVSNVAELLSTNQSYKIALRGQKGVMGNPGVPPSVTQVSENLMEKYSSQLKGKDGVSPSAEDVGNAFWKNYRKMIVEDESLRNAVATQVYLAYGDKLRGQSGRDGISPDMENLQTSLSEDPVLAEMVATFVFARVKENPSVWKEIMATSSSANMP